MPVEQVSIILIRGARRLLPSLRCVSLGYGKFRKQLQVEMQVIVDECFEELVCRNTQLFKDIQPCQYRARQCQGHLCERPALTVDLCLSD